MRLTHLYLSAALLTALTACNNHTQSRAQEKPQDQAISVSHTDTPSPEMPFVSERVKSENARVRKYLDFSDMSDFERAKRGFIATFDDGKVIKADGSTAYDFGAYDFLKADAPNTVNPSLWRQSQLNAMHGLFKVSDHIYQVRAYDLSNITFIEGDSGWIVIDPLISAPTAARAKALIDRELGVKSISAVIFTHSHVDHFGGVKGLVTPEDIKNGVQIIAPKDFVFEAVSENILAGNAMSRRASYMFGGLLPKGPAHQVGVGLGQTISSGDIGLYQPTLEVEKTGETHVIDGVEMEFIMAMGAEAPSEFMFYMPGFKAFCQAEIINHTLHNMYTPRGAKVRDGRLWSGYIDEAVYKYAKKTDISFGSHHWPIWGSDEVTTFWEGQRDLYRYIHDQTVRYANMGYTLHEIPEKLNMPDGIAKQFANRDYYGTLSHNSKSQYQLYYGYFDGNPANLDPLAPTPEAKKFIDYMGGANAVLKKAQDDFDAGEFRFAATVLNKLVFAEPSNTAASNLLAKTYDQLAYMAESGSWRNFYLTGAQELRGGVADLATTQTASADIVKAIPLSLYFDLLAVRLNAQKAAKKDRDLNFEITDTGQTAHLILSNGTLHHRMGQTHPDAPTIKITRAALDQLNLKEKKFGELAKSGDASIDGNPLAVRAFFGLIEEPEFWFEIVRP